MKEQTDTGSQQRQGRLSQERLIQVVLDGLSQMNKMADDRDAASRLKERRLRSNAHAVAFGLRE